MFGDYLDSFYGRVLFVERKRDNIYRVALLFCKLKKRKEKTRVKNREVSENDTLKRQHFHQNKLSESAINPFET